MPRSAPVRPDDVKLSLGEKLAACLLAASCTAGYLAFVAPTEGATDFMEEQAVVCPFSGVWQATFMPDAATAAAGQGAFADDLLFEDGQLMAGALSMYGFKPAVYATDSNSFTSEMTCDRGTLKFAGTHAGYQLSGTLAWQRADGTTWHYRFTARPIDPIEDADQ
jgi:hypothetical protein